MKKLNLEMLRLTSADVLERSQMKKITGGYGNSYYCHCIGSVGAWSGSYSSWGSAINSISTWCESGSGSCRKTA
jgi:natural product precursor